MCFDLVSVLLGVPNLGAFANVTVFDIVPMVFEVVTTALFVVGPMLLDIVTMLFEPDIVLFVVITMLFEVVGRLFEDATRFFEVVARLLEIVLILFGISTLLFVVITLPEVATMLVEVVTALFECATSLLKVVVVWFEEVSTLVAAASAELACRVWQGRGLGESWRDMAPDSNWQLLSMKRFGERSLRGFLILLPAWWWEGATCSPAPPSHLSTLLTQSFTTEGRPELNLGDRLETSG